MKIRIRLILGRKSSVLQVQVDDLLTRFFNFNITKVLNSPPVQGMH